MRSALVGAWERMAWGEGGAGPAVASALLLPFSWLYGGVVRAYRGLFDIGILRSRTADCAVVSVGNATVGGSGKTPVAIALARALRDTGRRVCIVSYGYGVQLAAPVVCASDGAGDRRGWEDVGDEAALMAELLPGVVILSARQRILAVEEAVRRFGSDVVVLDDGFQYWRVKKDLELLVISATRGLGNRRVFPAGPVREMGGWIRRADVVIVCNGGADAAPIGVQHQNLAALSGGTVPVALVDLCDASSEEPDAVHGRRVFALSGIGDPSAFESSLAELGAEVVGWRRFPDHHIYQRRDLEEVLCSSADVGADMIVTTDKDRVKIDADWLSAHPGRVRALRVEFRFDKPEHMQAILERIPEVRGG